MGEKQQKKLGEKGSKKWVKNMVEEIGGKKCSKKVTENI